RPFNRAKEPPRSSKAPSRAPKQKQQINTEARKTRRRADTARKKACRWRTTATPRRITYAGAGRDYAQNRRAKGPGAGAGAFWVPRSVLWVQPSPEETAVTARPFTGSAGVR